MARHLDYIAYFKMLADLHLANAPGNKTFYKKGLDEFLNGLSLDESAYPAMLLDRADFTYKDNGYDNFTKIRTVAFLIFDHVSDIQDYDAIDLAFDNSEAIIDKIYNQINDDRKNPECAAFLKAVDMNSFQATEAQNSGDGNYGYFVTVEIQSTHNTRLI